MVGPQFAQEVHSSVNGCSTFLLYSITTFADYVSELGHPYIWVQNLGGLQFSSDTPHVRMCS